MKIIVAIQFASVQYENSLWWQCHKTDFLAAKQIFKHIKRKPESDARSECDETTERMRLEGKTVLLYRIRITTQTIFLRKRI